MPRDISTFATKLKPLHPSGLRMLLVCPWRAAMWHMYDPTDEGGPAADTGSAMHVAVRDMHRGKEVADCLVAMREENSKYPQADLAEAAGLFLPYASDPRNRVETPYTEFPIEFSIEASKEDPTGARIEVIGTLDQIRRINGKLVLFDLKTSKKDPILLLHLHTFQMAAYCVGAAVKLGEPVHPGPLILPRKYRADAANSPVFYYYPWTFQDLEGIMEGLRHNVANIRRGNLWHLPGEHCTWCPQRSPDLCYPKLKDFRRSLRLLEK